MKKVFITLIFSMLLLCACSSEKSISGQVIEVIPETESEPVQFIILTDEEEKALIKMDEDSFVMSWVEDVDTEAFKKGMLSDVRVVASYKDKGKATGTDGSKMDSYLADDIRIHAVLEEDAYVLEDGTKLDIWKESDSINYQLKDGTKLLVEQTPYGPHNSYVGGVYSLDTMSEAAQEKVLTYYEEQGLLYDAGAELERAYMDHAENPEEFDPYYISQSVSPSASNEKVIWFLTSVMLPIDGKHGQEIRLGGAFDRETGEHISNFDLFSCPEEAVLQKLLDLAKLSDNALRSEMETVFKPEYITFFPENIEVAFPAGTLSGQEHCYMLGIDVNEKLCEILQDWAVPKLAE